MLRLIFLISFLVNLNEAYSGYRSYPEVNKQYKVDSTLTDWANARNTCPDFGGSLAMPENAAELAILLKLFSEYHPDPKWHEDKYLAVNFHELFKGGEFVTDTGVPIQYYHHKWTEGSPSSYGGSCGSINSTGFLYDASCDEQRVFICEKPIENNKFSNSNCSYRDPAYKYNAELKKYYKLHLIPRIWADALAMCRAEGGYLAIINSKKEENHLVSMFSNPEDRVLNVIHKDYALVGFHDRFEDDQFVTVKGDLFARVVFRGSLHKDRYVNWEKGLPDNAGDKKNCGSMHISGGINDFPCDIPAVFICESDN